jgi:hypothetical protein
VQHGWLLTVNCAELAVSGIMCQADQYERALAALGSLISGTKRSHGEKWQHAYEGMRVFLEVIVPCYCRKRS